MKLPSGSTLDFIRVDEVRHIDEAYAEIPGDYRVRCVVAGFFSSCYTILGFVVQVGDRLQRLYLR